MAHHKGLGDAGWQTFDGEPSGQLVDHQQSGGVYGGRASATGTIPPPAQSCDAGFPTPSADQQSVDGSGQKTQAGWRVMFRGGRGRE